MQNDFEKEVKDKLDSLRLDPKPPVWQNIEAQIRRKKERRRVLFWLPFFGLMLAGGLWLLLNNKTQNGTAAVQKKEVATKTDGTIIPVNQSPENKQIDQHSVTFKQQDATRQKTVKPDKSGNLSSHANTVGLTTLGATNSNNVPEAKAQPIRQSKAVSKQPRTIDESNTVAIKPDKKSKPTNLSEAETGRISSAIEPDNTPVSAKEKKEPAIVSGEINAQPTVEKKNDSPSIVTESKPDTALNKQTEKEKKQMAADSKKWKWAAVFGMGTTGVSNGLNVFGEKSAVRADALYATPATSAVGSVQKQSSVSQNGLSFSAGVAAKRKFSKRLQLSIGLQYNYVSNRLAVGNYLRQDTTVASGRISDFYANSGSSFSEKKNSFHFIGLPVGIQWQAHKKLPLMVQASLSVQRLISAEVLLYDAGSNVYYSNNEALNKTQFFLQLGLGYEFFQHKKVSLVVGPQLHYGLTGFEKKTGSQHLYHAGLGLQLQWNK